MKTSEVFELPAYSFGRIVADNISAGGVGSFDSADMAKVAANCINHADALADALELLLPHIESHRELGVAGEKAQHYAILVLAAYRGAK